MAMDDYFADDTGESADRPKARDKAPSNQTDLISKSVCPGMGVGDKLKFEIVRETESQYEIRYLSGDKSEEDEEEEGESAESESEGDPQSFYE